MTHRAGMVWLALWAVACGRPATTAERVRPGVDVLLADSAHLVRGKRVGLITNQTGVDASGVGDVERLLAAGVNLVALFSPEHGFRGTLNEAMVGHSADSATGLPIYSLYGEVRAPTAAMLRGIDVLMVDLQDIGARTYTYVSTTLLAMAAAGEAGVTVLVLDRPNPIGGELVQGPVLDSGFASFVGMLPIPLRHGMTSGELALLGRAVLGLDVGVAVVPAAGWRRALWFDATGLPWIRPSPSMPDLESATHYPGLVLFEATNLSIGRGTPIAFQVIAAPWLDAAGLREAVLTMPGVAVTDTVIQPVRPADGKYDGMRLPAVRLRVTDRAGYDPVRMAVRLLATLRDRHRDSLAIRAGPLDQRAGSSRLRRDVESGVAADSISRSWEAELAAFRVLRARYLLYR